MKFDVHPTQRAMDLAYKEESDLYHEICLHFGLSNAAHAVLYALCDLGEGCLQKDICSRCFLSKQTVHSAVQKLLEDGFLRTETGKGRDVHLFLTDMGVHLVQQVILPVAQAEHRALCAMTEEEQSQLIALTQKYLSLLREETRHIRL